MSISARRKEVSISFSDFSGGVNLSEDSSRINRNQVQYSLNAILRKNGVSVRPGSSGISGFDLAAKITGIHNHIDLSGNERIIIGSGGKVYSCNKTTGAVTERYNAGGSGNFNFATSLGKCFSANGTKCAKGEGDTWYQLGISAPIGASAAAANTASGALSAGVYGVYISYAREVSGTIVLYSTGQYLGTVTLAAPNDTVRISNFTLSTDPQVTHRVVWMTDPGGATIYRYLTTANTGSTTVDVENATAKSASIIYTTAAEKNQAVPAFEFIHAADGRLWGNVGNRIHYSLRNTSNAYDLERFFPLNYIDIPHKITGLFSIGENLYINTPVGIYVQPGHDVTARTIWIEKRWRFANMNTVVDYNAGKIGLTNDGIKFFDGEKFYDYDISDAVKSEISKMYITTSGFDPFACIIRRDIRTEYHIFYCDVSLHSLTNNRRLVLNLDKLAYYPDKTVSAPFEIWSASATHVVIQQSGTAYYFQSHTTAPKMFVETTLNTFDNGIYLDNGTLGGSTSAFKLSLKTRTELLDMGSRIAWKTMRLMARIAAAVTVQLILRDEDSLLSSDSVGAGDGVTLWDFTWDIDTWAPTDYVLYKNKLPMNLNGYMCYINIEQTANDPEMNILQISVDGIAITSRFT